MDITAGIVYILGANNSILGTGFVVSENGLIVTCSHVIQGEYSQSRNDPRPEKVKIGFQATGKRQQARMIEAHVIGDWWRTIDSGDVAFLQVKGDLPDEVHPLPLGSSAGTSDHEVVSFGFPDAGNIKGVWGRGTVRGLVTENGLPLLQLHSSDITVGFSGAPVWDKARCRVIGMVVEIVKLDSYHRGHQTAFFTPTETLREVCSALQVSDVCPYRNLEAFTETDAPFFFGRQSLIDDLVDGLNNERRFLAVFGPSGDGKSSLVQAGLIPRLRAGAVPGVGTSSNKRFNLLASQRLGLPPLTFGGDDPCLLWLRFGNAVEKGLVTVTVRRGPLIQGQFWHGLKTHMEIVEVSTVILNGTWRFSFASLLFDEGLHGRVLSRTRGQQSRCSSRKNSQNSFKWWAPARIIFELRSRSCRNFR